MLGKKKKTPPTEARVYTVTLKGIALLMAKDAGLLPRGKAPTGEDGWNVTPFLDFWSHFEPELIRQMEALVTASGGSTRQLTKELRREARSQK